MILGALTVALHFVEIESFRSNANILRPAPRPRRWSASPIDEGNDEMLDPPDAPTTDLTDRFKYKVHALMGSFDPPSGAVDDENQTGNIIGAMLQFPTEYTFTVVGKNEIITGEAESAGDNYAGQVKNVLGSVLGSDAKMEVRVVPRGTKFTRVSAKVEVESAKVVSSIYDELDALEATVLKF